VCVAFINNSWSPGLGIHYDTQQVADTKHEPMEKRKLS